MYGRIRNMQNASRCATRRNRLVGQTDTLVLSFHRGLMHTSTRSVGGLQSVKCPKSLFASRTERATEIGGH